MLPGVFRESGRITRRGTYSGNLVRGHCTADPGTVHDDPGLDVLCPDRLCNGVSEIRIINRVGGVCPEIANLQAKISEVNLELLLQWVSSVVGSDRDRFDKKTCIAGLFSDQYKLLVRDNVRGKR